jgi:hypothetical protein
MKPVAQLVVAASLIAASAPAAAVCGAQLRGAHRIESANYTVAYRTQPAKVAVGKHFTIDAIACGKGGVADPAALAVDAFMPDHGHGMNYKAAVTKIAAGQFRAEGLMFHMPGRWELYFDVPMQGKPERLVHSIVLE